MDRPHISDMTGVRWNAGSPGYVRLLTDKDLNTLGLGDLGVDELRWDADNNWTVPVEMLNAQAVDNLLATGEFAAV